MTIYLNVLENKVVPSNEWHNNNKWRMTAVCILLLHHKLNKKTPTTAKQLHFVNILIFFTSTEHVFNVSVALRTPYNDTIHWRSAKHRILIVDENNRVQL